MPPSTSSLNVIFHGLCVFVGRIGRGFEVLLPDLGTEHTYKGGSWLGETSIQRGATLTLEGVAPGSAIFERRQNLMVLRDKPSQLEQFPRSSRKPYATLVLPRPSKIYSLRPVVLTPGVDLVGKALEAIYKLEDREHPHFGKVLQSTVQVFQYSVSDQNRLSLTNHRWIPAFHKGWTNLHVFAEPETPQPVSHSITEFAAGSRLFKGLDLKRARASMLGPIDFAPPPGIGKEELEDLVPRTRRLALLGRYRLNGEEPGLAWDDDDPYGGDPTACVWGADGS